MTGMTQRPLALVFPQWQGSGKRKYVYYGAKLICEKLLGGTPYREVKVSLDGDIGLEKGIWGYRQIQGQLADACGILKRERPDKIFLIGGDCGTEVAPVSYLNMLYKGDLAVLWLDAHGDLNSPETSVSHNFHGMPLRCLLGEGDGALVSQCFSTLRPSQIIMGGLRDLDPPEAEFIENNGISVLTVEDIERDAGAMARLVEQKGYKHIYIHIDLDVLDSGKCPWALCLTPDGMSTGALMALLSELKLKLTIAGISIVELKPIDGMDTGPLRELVNACKDI